MAFRKLCFDWPLADGIRPVRLEWIRCWYDGEPILPTIYCRDRYRQEVLTIPSRTLLWNVLYDFLWDWAATRTHRLDQEYEVVFNLIEYISDFFRPPWCVNDCCYK